MNTTPTPEEKCLEFWSLLDRAFNSLYSSQGCTYETKEKIINSIEAIVSNVQEWKFLTDSNCGGFYQWLMQHFTQFLLEKELSQFHHKILSSIQKMFNALALANNVLFNIVVNAFVNILKCIIEKTNDASRVNYFINISHDVVLPSNVRNKTTYVQVTSNSSVETFFKCFYELCKQNFDALIIYSKGLMFQIITILNELTNILFDSQVVKVLFLLTAKTVPLLTVKMWSDICGKLNMISVDFEILDSFVSLMNTISDLSNCSDIKFVLLKRAIEMLSILCETKAVLNVKPLSIIIEMAIKSIPCNVMRHLNVETLLPYAPTHMDLLGRIFKSYLSKSVSNFITCNKFERDTYKMTEVDGIWEQLMISANNDIESTLTEQKFCTKKLKNIVSILNIALYLKPISDQSKIRVTYFDLVRDRVLELFTLPEVTSPASSKLIGLLIDMGKIIITIQQEKEMLTSGILIHFECFMFSPWSQDSSSLWAHYKNECYDALLTVLSAALTKEDTKLQYEITKVLYEIASKEKEFFKPLVYKLIKFITVSPCGYHLYHPFLKESVREETIDMLLLNSETRNILPCFFSGHCIAAASEWGLNLKCRVCDLRGKNENLHNSSCDHLKLLGYAYVKLITNPDILVETKIELLSSIERYATHISQLRSQEMINVLSSYIANLLLMTNLPLITIMKCFLLDSNGNFIVKTANLVVKNFLKTFYNQHVFDNVSWATSFFDFLVYLSRLSEDYIILTLEFLVVIIFNCPLSNIKVYYLKEKLISVAETHNYELKQIIVKHEEELSEIWIDTVIRNIKNRKCGMEYTLTQIAKLFNMNVRVFLEYRCMSYMISYILRICTLEQSRVLINSLSQIMLVKSKDLIVKGFPIIFSSIYFSESEEVISKALKSIEIICEKSIATLVYISYKNLISYVIMNADKPVKVIRFFEVYASSDESMDEDFGKVLLKYSLGFLTVIDAKLSSKSSSDHIVESCIRSIPHLLQLLGPENLATIRIKLLATLRTGLPLHCHRYPKLCLEAWIYFVYSVDCSFWGPYLTTIFTLLLPFVSNYSEDISMVFFYLVVKNGNLYPDYIPELFFVTDSPVPKMHEVWERIQQSTLKLTTSEVLQKTLVHIRNGVMESRVHSLNFLHHLLKVRRYEVLQLINQSDELPGIFSEVIDCLMQNIHYGNKDIQMVCVRCLGELGAINPAKFGYRPKNEDLQSKNFNVTTISFAQFIVNELLKALQKSSDSHAYNTIASCIQELLKIYFSNDETALNGFLQLYDTDVQDTLKSMIGSRYIFSEPVILKRRHEKLGSIFGKKSFEWASSWAGELIAMIPPGTAERLIFKTCLAAMKLDFAVLEALLPHILLKAILEGTGDDDEIIEMDMEFILKIEKQDFLGAAQDINLFKNPVRSSDSLINYEISEEKSIATVLNLIDFLYNYLSYLNKSKTNNAHLEILSVFLKKFPSNLISYKAYCLKDYCRSLFYLEQGLDPTNKEQSIEALRNIYSKLNDADGLLGVMRTAKSIPTAEESMVDHIVCGNVQDALPAYELLATQYPESTECCRGLVQCYLNLNCPNAAYKLAEAYFSKSEYENKIGFSSEAVETACRHLMTWDLEGVVNNFDDKMKNNWSWSVDIGIVSLNLFKQKFDSMHRKVDSIQNHIAERLAAISNTPVGTYRQGYNHIVSLHILNDYERYAGVMENSSQLEISNSRKMFDELHMDSRSELLPSSGYYAATVMNHRIQALSLINKRRLNKDSSDEFSAKVSSEIRSELGKSYLEAAKIARKNMMFSTSYSYLALAEKFPTQGLFIEKAKLHKSRLQIDTAICILRRGIQEIDEILTENIENRKISAQAKLLIARYNEENMNVDHIEGSLSYLEAINTFPTEKNYRYLAQYLYNIHSQDSAPDSTLAKCEIQVQAMKNFASSLQYGCKYIYQSMFCMISLWLDFGMRFKDTQEATGKHPRVQTKHLDNIMNQMNETIREAFESLPSYIYMAIFSQLLSRVNHPLHKCQELLIIMIAKVAIDYPQQAFWMMAPIWKMEDHKQNKIFQSILKNMRSIESVLNSKPSTALKYSVLQLFGAFNELVDILINICTKKVPMDQSVLPLKSISQKLILFLEKNDVPIMIPSQKLRTICLPKTRPMNGQNGGLQYNAFPSDQVYFHSVHNQVQVLASLQRPKKIVFVGSDGKSYPFMCKPMDDLRLDSRIMEFCSVVNMYLQRDPDSSDRSLRIQTYSVVPINQRNGLIEWVPDLVGYRTVVAQIYQAEKFKTISFSEIRRRFDSCKTNEEKVTLFEEILLPGHPPVLDKWFDQQFPSSDAWYLARKTFIRTTGVMSIVGYMVGLGDRHGENILLNTTTGAIMHVDFNCLFGRGEQFQVAEVVPFRLTQNMICAMGPTGIEGQFIKTCEITARVIRNNADQLLHVIKPFLYDPKMQKSNTHDEKKLAKRALDSSQDSFLSSSSTLTLDNADPFYGAFRFEEEFFYPDTSSRDVSPPIKFTKQDVNTIQKKMAGCVITPRKKTPPLSVEGQVRCLVNEATDPKNLGVMFYGWTPFL